MRILPPVRPTPEQLKILGDTKPGFVLIRGAAGSGKTTTALLRLQQLCAARLYRQERLGLATPVRVLVLTYNRTLQGYISELAQAQVAGAGHRLLQLEVLTFGKWAYGLAGGDTEILHYDDMEKMLRPFAGALPWSEEFLAQEVDYVLGRFEPDNLDAYLTARREGRGTSPRVEQPTRRKLLDEVVAPYKEAKESAGVMDWHDMAAAARAVTDVPPWDIVIVDEAQDFSANQVRALLPHLDEEASMTFVMDAMQRIYPRYFSWTEAGISRFSNIHSLKRNYRNTQQIAAFARPIVDGLTVDDDGALPDFEACTEDGPIPVVLAGRFSRQVDYIVTRLLETVDFGSESVAFLHPKGGNWFGYLRTRLRHAGLPYTDLTRMSDWPTGPEAIALSTIHSAKGLEFDHVILPGLNAQVTPHGTGEGDAQFDALRRLIAMGVGRARKSVIVGFKPQDPSRVIGLFKTGTYQLVSL
jgi:superfamily I DNA/RNA helicase